MGAVVLGRLTEVPRSKLIGWVALVAVLASISYSANFLADTDNDVTGASNTAPITITTSGSHGFVTGDTVAESTLAFLERTHRRYVQKPFSIKAYVAALRETLHEQKAA